MLDSFEHYVLGNVTDVGLGLTLFKICWTRLNGA
jgi:hypothetical protein